MSEALLELRDLHVEADGAPILRGVSLVVNDGEVHALMGPNGAGKSTLANVIMGHPGYRVTAGEIFLRGENIATWTSDERARHGIFLAFQYPEAISGVSVIQFLRQAIAARKGLEELSVLEVRLDLAEWMDRLGMDPAFAERHLNEGFSGGERKRNEILQMALLEPVIALLDETDSGLDIDALRVVARGVRTVREEHPSMGVLLVTHYVKLLEEIKPEQVHILVDGRIVESGDASLATRIEEGGYDSWRAVSA
ncbi:MAG TPA: Fe-S cluster assembly ATPase SufC [Acidimicrobiales bacterium]|nr:Fe-S cluster assembly ATPase SufC [Acidimicrobiales bacterium]